MTEEEKNKLLFEYSMKKCSECQAIYILKAQIEKMKCCGNCIHSYEEKYDGLCCDLFDGAKYVPSIEKRDCDKWELSEGK